MELHGGLLENLRAAIGSSKRLQGQPVYPDTLQFWSDLVQLVRCGQVETNNLDDPALARLADQLDREIRQHRDR